ncbi:reverse transcriptase domain-containing protein [Tanacetum coccineum]
MVRIICTNPKKSRVSFPRITFSEDDPIPEHCTGDDPLIITADIGTTQIHMIYVDGGSSTEIMYEHCFEHLLAEEKKTIRPPTTPLVGFQDDDGRLYDREGAVDIQHHPRPSRNDAARCSRFYFTCLSEVLNSGRHRHHKRNIEIYVDDMVIKSNNEGSLITNITKTFDTLRKANMKLNPKKCTFGVESGQFLGYMITNEGIQANPEKVQAIINMASPRTLQEVQALNGKLATLRRFLAKSIERYLPFFKTLKGCLNKKDFRWNAEAEAAFQELKSHLQSLLALTVLLKPENSGCITKWAIKLGEHEILYKPRSAIKGQILVDFLAESPTINDFIEGSSVGLILTDPNGQEITYALRFNFRASNNEAEYEALVAGLELAIQMEAQCLTRAGRLSSSLGTLRIMRCTHQTEKHRPIMHISSPWPFYQWGVDIVGPFPEAPGWVKFLKVAIDYFTKWAEAEPVATITGHKAYRTTARVGNGCTPFSLVYGSEAVLPLEIVLPTYRISTFQPPTNDTELRLNLDLLEERQEMASLWNTRHKRQVESYYNKKVRHN